MSHRAQQVYLFSSDQSPLYAQDILNVLGAPRGHPYRFRYDGKYLDPALKAAWGKLQDIPVLVVFSLQQRARYQQPAFVPIRSGWVLATHREGNSFFVEFRLGDYASLPFPPLLDGSERPDLAVQDFTELLGKSTAVPYDASASIGGPLPSGYLETKGRESLLFQRTAEYLSHAAAFANASFVRVLGIKPADNRSEPYVEHYASDPVYYLTAGKTYDLGLFYAQTETPKAPRRFAVSVDESAVRTIGRGNFAIESRYDEVKLRLAATQDGGVKDRRSVILVEPDEGVPGPTIELEVNVQANRGKTVGVAAMQTVALLGVAMAGVLTDLPLALRITLAVIGAIAAVALGLLGAQTLRAPSLPSSSPRPSQAHAR
jgi:hypothetical protein